MLGGQGATTYLSMLVALWRSDSALSPAGNSHPNAPISALPYSILREGEVSGCRL